MRINKKATVLALVICMIISAGGIEAQSPGSPAAFKNWLNETGTPVKSVSGMYEADFSTYKRYNLIVYGKPSDVPGNDKREGEYRYLGFTYMEAKYTNNRFPNDETWINKPEDWDYVPVDGAAESWDSLEQNIQKPYMLGTPLEGHGADGLTAADIGKSRAKVQSPANWTDSGSIYTLKSNSFYATFIVPSMGRGILSAELECEEAYVENGSVKLNLTASVDKPTAEVAYIKAVFNSQSGGGVRFFHNTNSIKTTHNVPVPDNLELPCIVQYGAFVSSESIFGDKLEKTVTCEVLLRDAQQPPASEDPEEPGYPMPEPTYEPIPVPTTTPAPQPTTTPAESDDGGDEPEFIITGNYIQGSWECWGEVDRFLALENIKICVAAMGNVDRVVFRLSPELEAMSYTNSEGHTYDYAADFFGEYVTFPGASTVREWTSSWGGKLFSWSYNLPLCDETVNWEGERSRVPYQAEAHVFGKDGSVETVSMPIDITGNIYEMIHPQPAD